MDDRPLGAFTHASQISEYIDARWRALLDGAGTVDCGSCRGCCRAGYVIGLSKAEAAVLPHTVVGPNGEAAIIPLLNHDCPLLIDNKCSVYEKRPTACREYDCRDFAFAGTAFTPNPDRPGTQEIMASVQRQYEANGWRIVPQMQFDVLLLVRQYGMGTMTATIGALVRMLQATHPGEERKLEAALFGPDRIEIEAAERLGTAFFHAQLRAAGLPVTE